MSILVYLLAVALGFFIFLFIFWRRLKEDYSANLIFNSGFLFFAFVAVFSVLFLIPSLFLGGNVIFQPNGLWFWGAILGFVVALRFSIVKIKLKAVETFEAAILGSVFWLMTLFLGRAVSVHDSASAIFVIILVTLFLLFYYLEKKYKQFSWYKSGKVGFSGLCIAGLFFVVRMVLAYFEPGAFSVVGKIDVIVSAIAAFLLFFSLYNLAER